MNRLAVISILLLLNFFGLKAHAVAVPPDTVAIRELIERADALGEDNLSETFQLFAEAQEQARKAGYTRLLADALLAESYYYFATGDYKKVIPKVEEAAAIYRSLRLLVEETKCLNREGVAHMYLNNYAEALRSLFAAKALAETTGDKKLTAGANNNIGLVYESLNDWSNALLYAQKALADKITSKDTLGLARSYGNIANLHYYQKEYDLALDNFRLANTYCQLSNNPYQLATMHSDMANLLADMGQLDSAIHYQNLALEFHEPLKEERLVAWCHTVASLGSIWLKKGNLAKAALYLSDCKTCGDKISDLTYLKSLYKFQSEYYAKTGNYMQATRSLQLLDATNDSLLIKSDHLENQRIAIRYEFDQKAREDSLQYQLKITQQEIATASYKNKMYLFLVFALIIAGVSAAVIRRIRKIQQDKRHQELETMRSNIAGDLHDDVGSTLSSIQIISSLALKQCNGNDQLAQSVGRISELSDKLSDGIREIVWSVNPAHDRLQSVTAHLRKMAADVLGANNIAFKFNEDIKDESKELTPQQRKDLIMIVKEALNNARKYSGTERADIHIMQDTQFLTLHIKDYGSGFDMESVTRGNGLGNMERRAAEINAQLTIHTQPGCGTFLSLKIPLP